MLYPEISKLMKEFDSRYSLVIATAKRARQLALNNATDDKPVSRAISEIAAGKVKPRKVEAVVEAVEEEVTEAESDASDEVVE